MIWIHEAWKVAWRSALVALGYVAGLILAGVVGGLLGLQAPAGDGVGPTFIWMVISAVLLGVFLGPVAGRLALARRQHLALWTSLIFFNMGAVAIEGAYFVPGLVSVPIPVLLLQQLFAAAGAALVIALVCAAPGLPVSWRTALRQRSWSAWLWRFVASSLTYVLLYYVFGALNYAWVTGPYYAAHAGGLAVPTTGQIIAAELVRAPLLMLSVSLYLLSTNTSRRRAMLTTGWLLFAVGGIVPLVIQIGALPPVLLAASAAEIFCQNFGAGLIAAWLLTPAHQLPKTDAA